MHKIKFRRNNKDIELDLDASKAPTAIQVLELFGYKIDDVQERPYAYIERVYVMREEDGVRELRRMR